VGWHTRRLPGGGVLMGVGKLAQEGKVYRGVGSLPYCLGYLFFFCYSLYESRVRVYII